jgi:hypothetical protein
MERSWMGRTCPLCIGRRSSTAPHMQGNRSFNRVGIRKGGYAPTHSPRKVSGTKYMVPIAKIAPSIQD